MPGRKGRKKVLQFVDNVIGIGTDHLQQALGLDAATARAEMTEIARAICLRYARTMLYVPVDVEISLSARDQAIWDAFHREGPDGARSCSAARITQLASEHRVSEQQLYSILSRMRQLDRARRQPELQFEP